MLCDCFKTVSEALAQGRMQKPQSGNRTHNSWQSFTKLRLI